MHVEIIKLKTKSSSFWTEFEKFKKDFLVISTKSYTQYYGDEYQLKRISDGQCTLYLATVNNKLVGISYVKKNLRRGGTAVFPEKYRRNGIAEKLVRTSLLDFPKQYTILRTDNSNTLSLMKKVGFKKAKSIEEIRRIVRNEFSQLSDFQFIGEYLVFNRTSLKRKVIRKNLTLLHSFF